MTIENGRQSASTTFVASDVGFFSPQNKSLKPIQRRDYIGTIVRRWPVMVQHEFQWMLKNEKLGPARLAFRDIKVLKRVDTLEEEALRGLFKFIKDPVGSKAIGLITSARVLDTFPIIRRFGRINMMRFLNIIQATAPSEEITKPSLVKFLAAADERVRPVMLASAEEYGNRGVQIIGSEESMRFVSSNQFELLDPNTRFHLFRAAAAKGDLQLFSDGFINEIAPLNSAVRVVLLEKVIQGMAVTRVLALARINRSHQRAAGTQGYSNVGATDVIKHLHGIRPRA